MNISRCLYDDCSWWDSEGWFSSRVSSGSTSAHWVVSVGRGLSWDSSQRTQWWVVPVLRSWLCCCVGQVPWESPSGPSPSPSMLLSLASWVIFTFSATLTFLLNIDLKWWMIFVLMCKPFFKSQGLASISWNLIITKREGR